MRMRGRCRLCRCPACSRFSQCAPAWMEKALNHGIVPSHLRGLDDRVSWHDRTVQRRRGTGTEGCFWANSSRCRAAIGRPIDRKPGEAACQRLQRLSRERHEQWLEPRHSSVHWRSGRMRAWSVFVSGSWCSPERGCRGAQCKNSCQLSILRTWTDPVCACNHRRTLTGPPEK